MGRLRGCFRDLAFFLAFLVAPLRGAHELKVVPLAGPDPGADLVLASDSEVQGVVAAFDWDTGKLTGSDLAPGAVLDDADLVIRRVEPGYMVLGVVMDDDGAGVEIIPAGTRVIATARFRCPALEEEPIPVDLAFRDGVYGTADLGPRLDNLITVGGLTISRKEGLVLTGGKVSCPKVRSGRLRIRDTVAGPDDPCAPVDILLDTFSPIQGFTISVAGDPAELGLREITVAGTVTESDGADFLSSKVGAGGGTLEAVMDLQPPFQGNTIPIGNSQVIARYVYCCLRPPAAGSPDSVHPLRFSDGVFGDPPVVNSLLVAGQRLPPEEMIPGTFTCRAGGGGPHEFRCGSSLDPLTGLPLPITGFPGGQVQVSFFYRSEPRVAPGEVGEDQIQGLSMAICYDPRYVLCQEGTLDVRGTITESMGAEFVNHHCENSLDDGDPGELVIGILVDAAPPFDGQTLPPTSDLLRIASITFSIAPDAPCDKCNQIAFCDGANGKGGVRIRNLMSVNNFAAKPTLFSCDICVAATPVFRRGDCNFSSSGGRAVDLADPAAIITFLFDPGRKYRPPCLSACDANDDGRIDLGDAVLVLRYLYREGKVPPDPGPDAPGPDPTPDRLDCIGGSVCP